MHLPGATPLALLAKMSAERPRGVFKPVMAEDIGPLFERNYAEAMAWRKTKGISATEVARVAQRKAG